MKIKTSVSSRAFDAVNILLMVFLMFAALYPFYYIAVVSVSSGKAVIGGRVNFWPVDFTLMSYKLVLRDPYILTGYKNTLIYTLLGTFINLVMTMACAYPLSRPNLQGKKFLMGFIVFTMYFSGGMIPTYMVVNQLGMIDTVWAMVLPGAISTYNMIIMRTFFMGIPSSLHESGYLDGANDLQVFIRIVMPLSLPIIATMVLFYAVGHWNAFLNALLYLNEKKLYPLQSILRNMVVEGQMSGATMDVGSGSDFLVVDTTIKYAVIMVATLPILFVYPFVQKYFVKGVMIGSLKG